MVCINWTSRSADGQHTATPGREPFQWMRNYEKRFKRNDEEAEKTKKRQKKNYGKPIRKRVGELPPLYTEYGMCPQVRVELDTVSGPVGTAKSILTFKEMDSQLVLGGFLMSKSAECILQGINEILWIFEPLEDSDILYYKTDYGAEFALVRDFGVIEEKLYSVRPQTLMDKINVERYSKVLRQLFPKDLSFDEATEEDLRNALREIATKRVESLMYCSPLEVFEHKIQSLCKDRPKAGQEVIARLHKYLGISDPIDPYESLKHLFDN